jgi:hypothetical protein
VLVTRTELEALIRPRLLRSVELPAATVRAAGLVPDRLAGVYLVGGSSRIPLAAMLIAEQLHIVPTNLDQPETAVAPGAHRVAPEGLSPRTHVVRSHAGESRTVAMASRPRPAGRHNPGHAGHRPATPARGTTGLARLRPGAPSATAAGEPHPAALAGSPVLLSAAVWMLAAVVTTIDAVGNHLHYLWQLAVAVAAAVLAVLAVVAGLRLVQVRGGRVLGAVSSGLGLPLLIQLVGVVHPAAFVTVLLPPVARAIRYYRR